MVQGRSKCDFFSQSRCSKNDVIFFSEKENDVIVTTSSLRGEITFRMSLRPDNFESRRKRLISNNAHVIRLKKYFANVNSFLSLLSL